MTMATPAQHDVWFPDRCTFLHTGVSLRDGGSSGGGRGLYTTSRIPCGAPVLAEKSLLLMPPGAVSPSPLAVAKQILFSDTKDGEEALRLALSVLHPKKLSDIPASHMDELRSEIAGDAEALSAEANAADDCGGALRAFRDACVSEPDCAFRLLVCMRFNPFQSGMYFAFAMLNHACRPNCIKFTPDNRRAVRGDCSELVAIRDIEAGEELSISYLVPPEQPFLVRKAILEEQHFFSLSEPGMFPKESELLVAGAHDSHSIREELSVVCDLVEELEGKTPREMRQKSFLPRLTKAQGAVGRLVGPHHMLHGRLGKVVLKYCDAKLAKQRDEIVQRGIVLDQLKAVLQVIDNMSIVWGEEGTNHHELGTFHDIASEAVEFALCSGDGPFQAELYQAVGVKSFSEASSLAAMHRSKFLNISGKYSAT